MYIYHIYRVVDSREVSIEYVAGAGNETIKELQEIANFRLSQLKSQADDPESICMSRSLVPGI
jgi:hypothetical protein